MGACEFFVTQKAKSPAEAFKKAVEQAQYDHGHAGYSGTIAEKRTFVLINDSLTEVTRRYKTWTPEHDWMRKSAQVLAGLLDADVKAIPAALMDMDDSRIRDKWGPAGCVKVGKDEYAFFGWASS